MATKGKEIVKNVLYSKQLKKTPILIHANAVWKLIFLWSSSSAHLATASASVSVDYW